MSFPNTFIGRVAWLSSAAAAVTACVLVVLTVNEAAPVLLDWPPAQAVGVSPIGGSSAPRTRKVAASSELAEKVRAANALASAKYSELVTSWREELVEARNSKKLRTFVGELTSYAQKLHYTTNVVYGDSGDVRVLASFRQIVMDDRDVSKGLQATIEAYERFLAEQDRQILEAAGMSPDVTSLVQVSLTSSEWWRLALEPVIARATREARLDVARSAGSYLAGNYVGNEIHEATRDMGLNTTKQGSFGDMLWGAATDLTAGVLIDRLTDPTNGMIKRLSQELSHAEFVILDGKGGLRERLGDLKSAHESARAKLLSTQ